MRRILLHSLLPAALLTLLFLRPSAAMQGVTDGIRLWATAVLPALLPFYVVTELMLQCGALQLFSPLFRPLCRLMRLPDDAGGLVLAGWLSGTPGGARLLVQRFDDASVCTRFCACATVSGPLFLIGMTGQLMGSPLLGALVYGIQLLAAICNGLLWRRYGSDASSSHLPAASPAPVGFLSALPDALQSSGLAMLFIGSAIAFFSALTAVLEAIGLISALERILRAALPTDAVSALLAGFFEVSQGVQLAALGRMSLPLCLSLLCAFAAFGGVSVLCQAKVFLKDRVHTVVYFFQRITHAVLSFAMCRALCLLAGGALPTMALAQPLSAPPPASSAAWLLPVLCLFFSLLHKRKRPMNIHRP